MKCRPALAVLASGLWINASEFFRNEVLLKSHWVAHYKSMGLAFPSEPQNGLVWVAWGFLFAATLYFLTRKLKFLQAALLGWTMGFVLMWLVTWNLGVLPQGILLYAVPLSLLEVGVAVFALNRIAPSVPD